MQQGKLLCLGFGYVARQLAETLAAEGWRIAGTARSAEKAVAVEAAGAEPVLWTEDTIDPDCFASADAILISTPPSTDGCPAYQVAERPTAENVRRLRWIGYLSSNSVYGDHGGAWVDETSALTPMTTRGRNRTTAEAAWATHCAASSLPLAIIRLPGIYGPGRSALDTVREGRAQRIVKQGQVFNRMHVDDIAATLRASLSRPEAGALFNLSDDEPSPPQDVIEYACKLLGVEAPPLIALGDAALSDMAKSFYAENKRIRNTLIKERLGVQLRYPTYREGLRAIYEAE